MPGLSEKMKSAGFEKMGLAQQVAEALVKAILDRTLHGGDQLVETELQKLFGVSRSPLREAFRDLEKRGLVEIKPRRGTFVKKITRTDIDEHYPIQAALEGLAARETHTRMTPALTRRLTEHLAAMEAAVASDNVARFMRHHEQFHHLYIDHCGNRLLIDMIRDLRLRGTRLRYFFPHTPENCRDSLRVHRRIARQLGDRSCDPQQVEQTVRDHIERMVGLDGWEL